MVQFSRHPTRVSDTHVLTKLHYIFLILLCSTSFYFGQHSQHQRIEESSPNPPSNQWVTPEPEPPQETLLTHTPDDITHPPEEVNLELLNVLQEELQPNTPDPNPRFESSVSYLKGLASVPTREFLTYFDYGIPLPEFEDPTSNVLLLYQTQSSLPNITTSSNLQTNGAIPSLDIHTATEHCTTMNVVTLHTQRTPQCLAIVNDYESYHLQTWKRDMSAMNGTHPLRAVGRVHVPSTYAMQQHHSLLQNYYNTMQDVLNDLKPLVEKVAVDNTVVVMVCNQGQSELLLNFICGARTRGLELGNVLVFATDLETLELVEGMGVTGFYDERNFNTLPTTAAKSYGDTNFTAMMFAKVLVVHLITQLNYNLLFQDVDVIWYQHPLPFFQSLTTDYDVYFQDDGSRSSRYAPLSANSGFYYVTSNARTRYLFTSLLYAGDQIIKTDSHQQVLIALMNEHASYFGLRVKVWSRDNEEFPGGWQYHRKKELMKKIMKGEVMPYIFHMSWTVNKENKRKFFEQMGEWYVRDVCIGKNTTEIEWSVGSGEEVEIGEECCLMSANVTCHYRDKPSQVPCRESDPIDQGKPSFW